MKPIEISVVIPVFNEEGSLATLHADLTRVLARQGAAYEILFIDDGSRDGTLEVLAGLAAADSRVRAISFRRNFGKAAALSVGFREARGEAVITMDGDLQDDPAEIPDFLAQLVQGYDRVSGWKRKRHDPLSKTWPSRATMAAAATLCSRKKTKSHAAQTRRVRPKARRSCKGWAQRGQ